MNDEVPESVHRLMEALQGAREAFGDHVFGFGAAFMLGLVFRSSPDLISSLLHVLAEGVDDDGKGGKLPSPKWPIPN
jgi:hypothetical protein